MNRTFSFELVRRTFDRFGWLFVEVVDGRRRVLARSDADYRSKKRARKAVRALQEAVTGAVIIDATGDGNPFDLPATTFEIGPYALPLVVGAPSATRATGPRRRFRERPASANAASSDRGDEAADEGSAPTVDHEPPAAAPARARTPRVPRKAAASKATRGAAAVATPRR